VSRWPLLRGGTGWWESVVGVVGRGSGRGRPEGDEAARAPKKGGRRREGGARTAGKG